MNARQLVLYALKDLETGSFADVVIDRLLTKFSLVDVERDLFTELTNGIVRRRRTLDATIDRLAKQPADRQPPQLRHLLRLGLYQLQYLDRIPPAAAVNTTVDLAKTNGLAGLAGVVNGILRQYLRLKTQGEPTLNLPPDPVARLGILYSFPDWLVAQWIDELGIEATEQLCRAFNQVPSIDLRLNPLKIDEYLPSSSEPIASKISNARTKLSELFQAANVELKPIEYLPQGLRIVGKAGAIDRLPGYRQGWWAIQDCSAQLVTHLLDPQPQEVIIDACAAPGGKTTHIAELIGDRGRIIAIDKTASRLKKLQQNIDRLQLGSIEILTGDSCGFNELVGTADRVLLDAPCSGLGTLHRRADARWQKTPAQVAELARLQAKLLANAATWVKPGGVLVYATCTVCPSENEEVILPFLNTHPDWQIAAPTHGSWAQFISDSGWIKVWPHRHQMDGFFMVKLRRN